MAFAPVSISAPRLTPPAPPAPTATTINPASEDTQDKPTVPRVVNTSEKVENPSSDQAREQSSQKPNNLADLDPAEQRVLDQLKARDREVRAHEQAHLSAAGNLASGGASFTYQQGPDGQRYAIGGEVGINSATVANDPEKTLQRAQQIRRAALAPASPSAQDRSVAANAAATEQKAQAEIIEQRVKAERGQAAVNEFSDIATSTNETQTEKPNSTNQSQNQNQNQSQNEINNNAAVNNANTSPAQNETDNSERESNPVDILA
ncbi:MAG: hypothetical protein KAT25_08940 [Sulfuriflexus sp.]|nr:hypothetical protein [Sulfuriflexus sp.]